MTNSLKINVITIPEEGLNFVLSEEGKWFKQCFRDIDQPDVGLQRVDVNCLITRISGTIFIKGNLSVILNICCSRCLEDVALPIGGDFAYTLVPEKPETDEEIELKAEELEISYYQGDIVDLTPVICEQIILQIPIKALCAEDCKGLCPHCGTNLNVASCNCLTAIVDDRLAVLKDFRVKN